MVGRLPEDEEGRARRVGAEQTVGRQRDQPHPRLLRLDVFQPNLPKPQLLADRGHLDQVMNDGARVEAKTRGFGDGLRRMHRPADTVGALQDEHLQAGTRQVAGTREPVVPGPDDDDVAVRHAPALRLKRLYAADCFCNPSCDL